MPAKAATRKAQTIVRGQTSHIPTTIKNPERVELRRTELIEVATKMFLERGFHNTSIRALYAPARLTSPAFTCTCHRKRTFYIWSRRT